MGRRGGAGTVALQRVDARRGQQGAQVVRSVRDELEAVRVRRGGERHAVRHEALEQSPRRVLLPYRLVPSSRRQLRGHAGRHRRLSDAVPPLRGCVGHVAGHLDQVGMGQHVARARCGELLHRSGVRVPAVIDAPRRPLRHRHRVVEVVEAPPSDPVHRAEQHVEGIAGEQLSHAVHAALVVVHLEPDHDREPRGGCFLGASHVLVEVRRRMKVPIAGHGVSQRAPARARRPRSRAAVRRPGGSGRGARSVPAR